LRAAARAGMTWWPPNGTCPECGRRIGRSARRCVRTAGGCGSEDNAIRLPCKELQMHRHTSSWGRAVLLAGVLAVSIVGAARAGQDDEQKLLELFKQGITHYQSGEYAEARQAFDKVLAMQPGLQAALRMRKLAELGMFVDMKQKGELAPNAEKLLDLMTRAAREGKRKVEDPDGLVKDFLSPSLDVYGRARVTLRGHGPYGVPYLVGLLGLKEADRQMDVARAVALLADMHPDTCLPLIQVLVGCDDLLLKSRVAAVLGQIGDRRAVPALLSVMGQEALKDAAAQALRNITGKDPKQLGSAAEQYRKLAEAYFEEDGSRVGFTYGLRGDIWSWNPAGATMAEKVTYEQVPNFLYYQRMATEVALEGLKVAPADDALRALLAASLARQLALCEFFKAEKVRFGGKELEKELRDDAARRAEKLAAQVPVALAMLPAPVLAEALEMTLKERRGPASLYLVKALGRKLAAAGPAPPQEAVVDALMAAVNSGDRDVRYNAAIVLVEACPDGQSGSPAQIMDVMSAALRAAASRNALVVMDDLQLRNRLVGMIRAAGVATTEAEVHEGRVEFSLALQPSVDIVFISANAPKALFSKVMERLATDPRTKGVPLYVVADPAQKSARLTGYKNIEATLLSEDLKPARVNSILQQKVLAKSNTPFTDQEQALVLKAARALAAVSPAHTKYLLGKLEPSLIAALSGYEDKVTAAVEARLASFGTAASLEGLGRIVSGGGSVELKVGACRAIAAILKRSGGKAPEKLVAVLKAALGGKDQPLREAAAEALSAAGLGTDEIYGLVRTEGLGLK